MTLVVANAVNGVVLGVLVDQDEDVLVYRTDEDEILMTPVGIGVIRDVQPMLGRLPKRLALLGPNGPVR